MPDKPKHQPSLPMARIGVSVVFFAAGAIFANWIARIPQVQTALGLSDSALGFALMSASIGVLLGLTLASGLITRFGSRRVTIIAGVLLALSLIAPALAVDFWTLSLALFLLGTFNSVTDVAMNAQGVEVERRRGTSIMSSFHAAWSVGTFTGAMMGAQFLRFEVDVLTHFALAGVGFVFVMLAAGTQLVFVPDEHNDDSSDAAFQLPPRAVLPLGAVVFAAALGEGALSDWSGIYLRDVVGVPLAQTAWGFAAFSAMMTLGRLVGDWLVQHRSAAWLTRVGGGLATGGLLLALLFPTLPLTLLGFAMVGLGLATTVPLAFSASGRLPDVAPGRALAGVATIGYGAFLIGPSVIGVLADLFTLRGALVVVLVIVATLIVNANTLNTARPLETTATLNSDTA